MNEMQGKSDNPQKSDSAATNPPAKGRLMIGGSFFLVGVVGCPLSVPLITASALPAAWKATLSGLLLLGIPELFMLVAAAVLGKPGFQFLKLRLLGFLKRFAPLDTVNRNRHRLGLTLFVLPLVMAWLLPYFSQLVPGYQQNYLIVNIAGDLLLVTSLFILGGDFWDKVRGLFIHRAKIIFPSQRVED